MVLVLRDQEYKWKKTRITNYSRSDTEDPHRLRKGGAQALCQDGVGVVDPEHEGRNIERFLKSATFVGVGRSIKLLVPHGAWLVFREHYKSRD